MSFILCNYFRKIKRYNNGRGLLSVGCLEYPKWNSYINSAHITNAYERIARPPLFEGYVQEGRNYVTLNNTVSMGRTLAALQSYIECNGGKVILVTTLTGFSVPELETLNFVKTNIQNLLSDGSMNSTSQSNTSLKANLDTSKNPIALTRSEIESLRQDSKAAMKLASALVAQNIEVIDFTRTFYEPRIPVGTYYLLHCGHSIQGKNRKKDKLQHSKELAK